MLMTKARNMAHGLTPSQRKRYDDLRGLTVRTLDRYPKFAQRVLAEAVGVTQSFISTVLTGRQISTPTLEGIVRILMATVSTEDREELRRELTRALAALRDHRPRPPRARR